MSIRISQPNRAKIKAVFSYAWPFLILLLFFIFGWNYISPYVSELLRRAEIVKDKILGEKEEIITRRDPDAEYRFYRDQSDLKPIGSADIRLKENYLPSAGLPAGESVSTAAELVKAVESAATGAVIIMAAGEYEVNLEINRDAALYGHGSTTILKAGQPEAPVISVSGAKAVFKNFSITSARVGISAKEADIKIERLKFSGLEAMGLWVEGGKLDLKHSYFYDSGQGIGALNSSGRIEASIIQNSKKSGIELLNSDFQISGNIIENNGSYGVFIDFESKVELEGNYIKNNRGFNVRIEGERKIYR